MTLADWLRATAIRAPGSPALLRGEAPVADYARFARHAAGIGATLAARFGVAPGDRVGLLMGNRTEYLEALFGIWWAGAAAVPVNAKLHAAEAASILGHAEARAVLCDEPLGAALGDAAAGLPLLVAGTREWEAAAGTEGADRPVAREDGDLAWLFYTSGTTGRPKGVMLTHLNLAVMSLCYPLDVDPVSAEDAAFYAAPMSHGAGLYAPVHVRAGARHAVPLSGGFEPAEILATAPRIGRVSMFAAPTMVRRLVEAARAGGEAGEGIRTVVYGGGPMYLADIEEAVRVMGPRFVQIYGQGESPMTITALSRALVADRGHPRWRERLGSVGTAQSCVGLRIGDAEGRALPPGEAGEILVRGPQVMAGYWRDARATAETLAGGWLRTGDVGRMDREGFLTLTDRSKDVIISGGANVYPREVEEVLLTHPAVAEVSVVGRPDREWGETVVAFVVARPGAAVDPAALDAHCLARMARFKRPKAYRAVAELPKNAYGKVLKTELRRSLGEEPA